MTKYFHMKRNTKKGFYTLETSIFLPLMILSVLSLAYFIRIEGTWENCIHGAVDESSLIASKSYDKANAMLIGPAVSKRINDDNPILSKMKIKNLKIMYEDMMGNDMTSYNIDAVIMLKLPLGFSKEFTFDQGIKYRSFTGIMENSQPLGIEKLETYEQQNPVWVFPHSGVKYHDEGCTYVKASASPQILNSGIKKAYKSCGLCGSDEIQIGSIVFCFEGEDTAYHYGSCSSINRHTSVIDRSEAAEKGYSPCSKCGG